MTDEYRHVPVMLGEVLEYLDPQPGDVVCDCTLGGAGHTVELARRIAPDGLSLGIDQDDMALAAADALAVVGGTLGGFEIFKFHLAFLLSQFPQP